MAWTDFLDDACMMDKRTESDGMGGIVVTWTDGAPFRAGFIRNSSTEARIAYQNGIRELFHRLF